MVAQGRKCWNDPRDFAFCLAAERDDAIRKTQRCGIADRLTLGPVHGEGKCDVRLATEIVDAVGGPQILADVVVRGCAFLIAEVPGVVDFDSDVFHAAVYVFGAVESRPEKLDFQKPLVVIGGSVFGKFRGYFQGMRSDGFAGGVPLQRHL